MLSAVYLYISEYQAPIPNTPLKNQKTAFFLSTRNFCPVRIAVKDSKSKTDYKLKTDLQCLFRCSAGVQTRGKHLAQNISINIQLVTGGHPEVFRCLPCFGN